MTILTKIFPTCTFNGKRYTQLEEYVQSCENDKSRGPDLLLLIDLTDDKYKIGHETLTDYSFRLFKERNVLKEGSVIAFSAFEAATRTPSVHCISYQSQISSLTF